MMSNHLINHACQTWPTPTQVVALSGLGCHRHHPSGDQDAWRVHLKAEHGSIRGWSGSEPADQEHFFPLIQIRTDQICTDPDHFGSICGWSAVENKKKVNNQYLRWMLMDQCHIGYRVLSMLCPSVYPKSEQKPAYFTSYRWFTRLYCMWLSHFWAQLYVQYLSHGSI